MNTNEVTTRLEQILGVLNDTIKAVVKENPSAARATMSVHGPLVVFVVKTDPEDARWVFGRGGKHFKALHLLLRRMLAREGMEADLHYDEKETPHQPRQSQQPFVPRAPKKFSTLEDLVRRIVTLCVEKKEEVDVKSTDLGSAAIFEIDVANSDRHSVYGEQMTTEDGFATGANIEAIKNIFDAVGKNFGCRVRIILTK